MTIYVTEHRRSLDSTFVIKRLTGVYAAVSDDEKCTDLEYRDYAPEAWRALLKQEYVMYRWRTEPFRKIN